jgi:hypothetical protein
VAPFIDAFGSPGLSQVYGVELDSSWIAMEGLRIDSNFAYKHHRSRQR